VTTPAQRALGTNLNLKFQSEAYLERPSTMRRVSHVNVDPRVAGARRKTQSQFCDRSTYNLAMGNRLTKITTRTGDAGTTGLGDGTRILKSAPRIAAMGDIDELNSALGLLLTEALAEAERTTLNCIQNALFDLGGEICIPAHTMVSDAQVLFLDGEISRLNGNLAPLAEFVLPGGSRAASLCHVARTVARRAERSAVELAQSETVPPRSLQYLNRLSDYLFVLARTLNRDAGVADICWQRVPTPAATH
jgi:cob(I)alamin adenosyltransferase